MTDIKTDGDLTGEQIETLRLSLGYTQQHFAEMLNVSINAVRLWTRGTHTPHPIFQKKLKGLQRKAQSESVSG
jgi:DNA-binding transcriptional regulator YiaG